MKYIFICLLMLTSGTVFAQPTNAQNLLNRIVELEKQNAILMNKLVETQRSAAYAEDGVNYLFEKSPEYKDAKERGIIGWSIDHQQELDRARRTIRQFDNRCNVVGCPGQFLSTCQHKNKSQKIIILTDGRKLEQALDKLQKLHFHINTIDDVIKLEASFEDNQFKYTGQEILIYTEE